MTLLIFALFVILLAGLALFVILLSGLVVCAIDRSPMPPSFRWVAVVLVCLIAAVVVLQRMGVA